LLEATDIVAFAKKLFFVSDSKLHNDFDSENCRFGGYMSKPALGGRLKLDIKPLTMKLPGGESTERLQFAFNFHFDVPQSNQAVEVVAATLKQWNPAFELAHQTMQLLEEGNNL